MHADEFSTILKTTFEDNFDRFTSARDIQKEYTQVAFTCHPDRFGGDPVMEDRFKRLNEAYQKALAIFETRKIMRTRTQPMPIRGKDLRFRLHIDAFYAAQGGEVSFRFARQVPGSNWKEAEPVVLRVALPKGIKNGDQILLNGQGEPGKFGGEAGDLYVSVILCSAQNDSSASVARA